MEEFADTDLLILDGGPCRIGLESTVVDCTAEMPVVLRPGSIDEEAVATVWKKYKACSADLSGHEPPEGAAKAFSAEHAQATSIGLADADTLKSPGMLSSHYAPRLPVRMNATRAEAGEALLGFGATDGDLNLSPSGNLKEAAANLFDYLRKLDNAAFTGIAIAPIPAEGIGVAITDRIARAAAPRPCGETSDSPQ
jgi:L-threonylcarbamoyladenylate synthase